MTFYGDLECFVGTALWGSSAWVGNEKVILFRRGITSCSRSPRLRIHSLWNCRRWTLLQHVAAFWVSHPPSSFLFISLLSVFHDLYGSHNLVNNQLGISNYIKRSYSLTCCRQHGYVSVFPVNAYIPHWLAFSACTFLNASNSCIMQFEKSELNVFTVTLSEVCVSKWPSTALVSRRQWIRTTRRTNVSPLATFTQVHLCVRWEGGRSRGTQLNGQHVYMISLFTALKPPLRLHILSGYMGSWCTDNNRARDSVGDNRSLGAYSRRMFCWWTGVIQGYAFIKQQMCCCYVG